MRNNDFNRSKHGKNCMYKGHYCDISVHKNLSTVQQVQTSERLSLGRGTRRNEDGDKNLYVRT